MGLLEGPVQLLILEPEALQRIVTAELLQHLQLRPAPPQHTRVRSRMVQDAWCCWMGAMISRYHVEWSPKQRLQNTILRTVKQV